ncbi:MAG: septal ring lytic transglycosylase RlpA family protein [Xanthobacteraceae bacterium]|nr:septal ring lytic transglycosylase RlpA family protein [Xanthobacteraceae bacterium]
MGDQSGRIGLGWFARIGAPAAVALLVANCASNAPGARVKNTNYSPKMVADGEPVPRGGGTFKLGQPYTINGRTYYPTDDPKYRAEGIASWYGADFHGRKTANGEVYDMHGISAAHPTMPMPSYARVTNLENGRSIIVRVNDRGPYAHGRIIDLSTGTAKALGTHGAGLARVRVEYVGRAGLAGSDDTALMATLRHGTPAPAPGSVRLATAQASVLSNGDPNVMPLPPERPFFLGDATYRPARTAAPAAAPPPSPPAQPKRARSPVSVTPEYAVSEPAPPPERAPSLGLMSGRGLY